MRVVRDEAQLASSFSDAAREAKAAFGDGNMYVEKFLDDPPYRDPGALRRRQCAAPGRARLLYRSAAIRS